MKLLSISGSLRKESFNTLLMRSASHYAPEGVEFQELLCDLPLYNGDLDGDDKPESVVAFKQAITQADGVLFFTPEYNYSIPGPMKNAIDWASRPGFKSPLAYKPAAILSATPGIAGGVRMQQHLKQVLLGTLTLLYPSAEFAMGHAAKKFDENGRLSDTGTQEFLTSFLEGFVKWVQKQS